MTKRKRTSITTTVYKSGQRACCCSTSLDYNNNSSRMMITFYYSIIILSFIWNCTFLPSTVGFIPSIHQQQQQQFESTTTTFHRQQQILRPLERASFTSSIITHQSTATATGILSDNNATTEFVSLNSIIQLPKWPSIDDTTVTKNTIIDDRNERSQVILPTDNNTTFLSRNDDDVNDDAATTIWNTNNIEQDVVNSNIYTSATLVKEPIVKGSYVPTKPQHEVPITTVVPIGDIDWYNENDITIKDDNEDNEQQQKYVPDNVFTNNSNLTCRVVALSDSKIRMETLPKPLLLPPKIVQQMENIYHTITRKQVQPILSYMKQQRIQQQVVPTQQQQSIGIQSQQLQQQDEEGTLDLENDYEYKKQLKEWETKERQTVSTIRSSLEDAGYNLLCQRDFDLCNALNAGYLLRLSIVPDLTTLDASIGQEFYPELYNNNNKKNGKSNDESPLLFDGKVLIYWRGYSKEVTTGRLILPKIDYLQSSLVQRVGNKLIQQFDKLEKFLVLQITNINQAIVTSTTITIRNFKQSIPMQIRITFRRIRNFFFRISTNTATLINNLNGDLSNEDTTTNTDEQQKHRLRKSLFFQNFARYNNYNTFFNAMNNNNNNNRNDNSFRFVGAPNPTDALSPFIICEQVTSDNNNNIVGSDNDEEEPCGSNIPCLEKDDIVKSSRDVDRDIYEQMNNNNLRCPYDDAMEDKNATLPPMQLLERVSISNLVDLFTKDGRRKLIQTLISNSKLVEPTYEEVVVIWRPKRSKVPKVISLREQLTAPFNSIRQIKPPNFVYEIADMFDIEGLPDPPKPVVEKQPPPVPIEIRAFQDVPMANLQAVMPRTKLKLGPADALRFDLISVVSFIAIIGSLKFDNPKLDILAFVTVTLWIVRTVFRYSNKLARYDLLVKTFLTSKISHRNTGAVQYLTNESAVQRAYRAALVHYWLSTSRLTYNHVPKEPPFDTTKLQQQPNSRYEINELLVNDNMKQTPVNVTAAINDLLQLQLLIPVPSDTPSTTTTLEDYDDDDDEDVDDIPINTWTTRSQDVSTVSKTTASRTTSTTVNIIQNEAEVVKTLKRNWDNLFVDNDDEVLYGS